jgi:hypothetical protein
LRPSKIGTVRLPFSKVENVCQIGDDVKKGNPMFVLVTGQSVGMESKQISMLVSVDHRFRVKIVSDNLSMLRDITDNKEITSVQYV